MSPTSATTSRKKLQYFGLLALLLVLLSPAVSRADQSASDILLALKRLRVAGSALFIAAHPDDENTALLSYLTNERGVRAAYLSLTRGEGGQNLIGSEKGELLGLLRTQELLAARRIDGAEQFFTRAIDFGYSKSPEETLRLWNRDEVLSDMVWVIRSFRPDIIVTRFPASGGGHGQHTASAILAEEAFLAAGDEKRFPEQLKYVKPWKAERILWNNYRPDINSTEKRLQVNLGTYNPLLGRSYTELAGESRSMHKSQGFGSAERRGVLLNYLENLSGPAPNRDIFEGVDLSWNRINGKTVDDLLAEAYRTFDINDPQKTVPLLLRTLSEIDKLRAEEIVKFKRGQLLELIRSISGLWIESVSEHYEASPGTRLKTTVTLINRSRFPFFVEKLVTPDGKVHTIAKELKNNEPVQQPIEISLPVDMEYSNPYWLKARANGFIYKVPDQSLVGVPENPSSLPIKVVLKAGQDQLEYTIPTSYKWVDRVEGEKQRPFQVVPELTVTPVNNLLLFASNQSKKVSLLIRSHRANLQSRVRLVATQGWKVEPQQISIDLKERGDEQVATVTVTPPTGVSSGELRAELEQGKALVHSYVTLNYNHVPVQTVLPPMHMKLQSLDLKMMGRNVGYIMGSGDEIPAVLDQIGYSVTLLDDIDLINSDLSVYDALVVGVRAYNTRKQLARQQQRLLDYVAGGGTLLVQYNTVEEQLGAKLGPYRFSLSRDRVTHENAPVNFEIPGHQLLNFPNEIVRKDFDGWVQERGLYFPNGWDPKYEAPISTADPGEERLKGGLLFARHGRGVYIYTSYSWFRQLPAGVPGAIRFFTNMVSAGKFKQ